MPLRHVCRRFILADEGLKKSYKSIDSICKALKAFFGKHFISEIDTEMIEIPANAG